MARLATPCPAIVVSLASLLCFAPSAEAAWPHDPNVNVPLCNALSDQSGPQIVSDGAGGAIVTWMDLRGGVRDIYAQRVNAAGLTQWAANGVGVCTAADEQFSPAIASDGAGGAIITWFDYRGTSADVYAQRISAAGVPQWTANGVALSTFVGDQAFPTITSDGAGGAIVSWADSRSGADDVFAQRVNAAGAPQWTSGGVPVCTAANDQYNPMIASDGAGGAIITWYDIRSGSSYAIYAQRINATGAVQWPIDGFAVCALASSGTYPAIVSDGSGGAIVAWRDTRNPGSDIYAQRVSSTGAMYWPSNGVAVCGAPSDQTRQVLTSDGAGGAIVAWDDYRTTITTDVYAQHVTGSGTMAWTLNGVALSTAAFDQLSPTIASDGAGGAIVAWNDSRGGISYDIYAQSVNAGGLPQWTTNGIAVCVAVNGQHLPVAVANGSGGAIVAWYDYRNGATNADVYAQRIEHFGPLGNPEPTIASVRDVPYDNGGQVKVSWYASWLDGASDPNLTAYDIYRSAPGSSAELAVKQGAGSLRAISPDAGELYAWEYLGSVSPTHFLSAYGYIAPTTGDSVAAGIPRTIFMVVGRNSGGSMYWLSPPDSGYSVDNLPPSAPAPFTAAYVAAATHLHWGKNSESDLAGYRLYRGSSSGFTPGTGNLISAQPDTGYNDAGPAGNWYKLSAIDAHGNESLYATLGPNGTLDAPGAAVTVLAFASPAPNPVRSAGAMFRFALPTEARITLTLFDQQGRRVRDLALGTFPAGEHGARWDGRDESGHPAPSGIYFARLETMGRALRTRFAVVR